MSLTKAKQFLDGAGVGYTVVAAAKKVDAATLSGNVRDLIGYLKYNSYTKLQDAGVFTHIHVGSSGVLEIIKLDNPHTTDFDATILIRHYDLYGKPMLTVHGVVAPYRDFLKLKDTFVRAITRCFSDSVTPEQRLLALRALLSKNAKALTSAYNAAVAERDAKQNERDNSLSAKNAHRQLTHPAGTGLAPRNNPERRFNSNPKYRS